MARFNLLIFFFSCIVLTFVVSVALVGRLKDYFLSERTEERMSGSDETLIYSEVMEGGNNAPPSYSIDRTTTEEGNLSLLSHVESSETLPSYVDSLERLPSYTSVRVTIVPVDIQTIN